MTEEVKQTPKRTTRKTTKKETPQVEESTSGRKPKVHKTKTGFTVVTR